MSDAGSASLDAFFDTLFDLRPVDATFIGHHDLDYRWPDWTVAGHDRAAARWRDVAAALEAEGAVRALRPTGASWDELDRDLALSHVDLTLAEGATRHFHRGNPSLVTGEAAFGLIGLVTRDYAPATQRASHLLQRLQGLPRFLAGAMATVSAGAVPRAWTTRAVREAQGLERFLLEGIPAWCVAMAFPPDRTRALTEAAQGAAGAVHACVDALGNLPAADVDAVPAGEGLLDACIRRGHWISRSPDDLLAEVHIAFAHHKGRLQEMVATAGAASLAEVQGRLAQGHPSPAGYYAAFHQCWDACRALSDARELVTWPDAPLRYVPIPEWTRMASPSLYYLFYRSPAPRDRYAVYDYVVSPIEGLDPAALGRQLEAMNDATIKLNHVVHHGALGHHVQNWFAARAPSRIGQVAAADCASRLAMFLGGTMAEGWACYATDLMEEVGFLTPDEQVSEQHTRVRMLGRAIVDLEFHTGRRSLDDAVRLYVEEVGMSPEMARGEAVKNSMFPGTALMYWFGTQGVHATRAAIADREGDGFTLRAFHDRFLSYGSLPVTLIQHLMLRGD